MAFPEPYVLLVLASKHEPSTTTLTQIEHQLDLEGGEKSLTSVGNTLCGASAKRNSLGVEAKFGEAGEEILIERTSCRRAGRNCIRC